jgi:hypothetical protein
MEKPSKPQLTASYMRRRASASRLDRVSGPDCTATTGVIALAFRTSGSLLRLQATASWRQHNRTATSSATTGAHSKRFSARRISFPAAWASSFLRLFAANTRIRQLIVGSEVSTCSMPRSERAV